MTLINDSSQRRGIPRGLSLFNIMLNLMLSHALSMHHLCTIYAPVHALFPAYAPSTPRQGNPKKCYLISEELGINHYSLFGGFPDGAGFPLQSFLRQKRISAPIPNPRRLRGLREKAEWESLTRNFWGLDNVDLMLSHALSMLYLCSIHPLVHSPPMLRLDYKAIQKMLPNF